jgi:hypothetical protein
MRRILSGAMECSHFGQTVVNAALIFARLIFFGTWEKVTRSHAERAKQLQGFRAS